VETADRRGSGALFDHKAILRETTMAWRAAVAFAALAAAACSSLEPDVGPLQCAAVDGPVNDTAYYAGGADGGGYYSSSYGTYGPGTPAPAIASDGAIPTTCSVPSGSWCDDCESTNCCATRLRCYADPTCAAADEAQDGCLADASADGGAAACAAAFLAQGGSVAAARVACEHACCPKACAIP
jgi:hypothetical protein